jgi:hypothetical protein
MAASRARSALSLILGIALCSVPSAVDAASPSAAAALRVLDDQLSAYNASDKQAFLATLHFPHVRIAGAAVRVFPNPQSYMPELSMVQHGWDYARWTERRVVQDSASKVHVIATFTRYVASGDAVDSYEGMYVIALKGGRWGVIARSSISAWTGSGAVGSRRSDAAPGRLAVHSACGVGAALGSSCLAAPRLAHSPARRPAFALANAEAY